jgi:hypothetical protein
MKEEEVAAQDVAIFLGHAKRKSGRKEALSGYDFSHVNERVTAIG